jgi:peptidoglycan hydrolase-like protein with peptidoglycan-binding domain
VAYPEWFRRLTSGQAGQVLGFLRARRSVPVAAVVVGAVVLLAGGAILVAVPGKATPRPGAARSGRRQAAPKKPPVHPAPALQVVSVTPASGARHVNGAGPVTVKFSAALAPDSRLPKLSPSVPGSWKRDGDTATFTPASGFPGGTPVTVHIPGGKSGVVSSAGEKKGAGGRLASPVSHTFTTGSFSTLRLQQLLAQLGYLPLTWSPAGSPVQQSDARAQVAAAYDPPAGTFSWQGGYPSQLHKMWQQGSSNLIDTGAIRAFESENNLTMDGEAGPAVWAALLRDIAANRGNANGYTYAYATKGSPESLTIWHDGHQVLQSPANTGIPQAPTTDGTYPVYEKLQFQVMKGKNPDGSKYADPVYWVSYFDGGQAVHYFNRGSYGFPQSLGCVELPYSDAKTSYRYLSYGSLVTVR